MAVALSGTGKRLRPTGRAAGFLALFAAAAIGFLPLSGGAVPVSGMEGDAVTWTLLEDGTLTIAGCGVISDYNRSDEDAPTTLDRPWHGYRSQIKRLVVSNGVTRIGSRAFQSCGCLESVSLPESLESIGEWAFQNCESLVRLAMPPYVDLAKGAFRGTPVEIDAAARESAAYRGSVYYKRLTGVALTGSLRDDVLAIARSQLGYHEGDDVSGYDGGDASGSGDFTEYGRYFASQGSAWCSEFTSWCIRMSGAPFALVNSSASANAATFTAGTRARGYA